METSFYYSSVTKVAGNGNVFQDLRNMNRLVRIWGVFLILFFAFFLIVQAQITPSPKSDFRLTELLNANIRLRSKMSLR